MSEVSLGARAGREPGSRHSRRIRRQGLVPAVVYGPMVDPLPLTVDARDLHTALHTDAGANAIIHLEIEGGDTITTMARAIEKHPFRNEYRHVDFVTVDLTKKVHAEVAIHFEGSAAGVEEGGVFSPQRTSVRVEVLPTEIPQFIELDISAVQIGDSLRVEDLPAIEGLAYLEDPNAVVMSVTLPAAEIEEPEPEEEMLEGEAMLEGKEVAEGEEAGEPEGAAETGEEAEDTEG